MKNLLKNLKKVLKGEKPFKDVWHYLVGYYRYWLWYNEGFFDRDFIRPHIKAQILYRIRVMKPDCYNNGECTECGCSTTALQMCNKPCDGLCYPRMLNKKEFKTFEKKGIVIDNIKGEVIRLWLWDGRKDKYILFEDTSNNYEPPKEINV